MKNIKRPEIPEVLFKFGNQWTQELLDEIEILGGVKHVDDSYFSKYRENDILEALEKMYNGICCFCETEIKPSGYERIEHRVPKKKYPKYTYDWDNLHLCCEVCNTKKGSKFNEEYEILDASKDVPITDHFKYVYYHDIREVHWKYKSLRGKTTCTDTELNRDPLPEKRHEVLAKILELKINLDENGEKEDSERILKMLKRYETGSYGSVVIWARKKLFHEIC